MTEQLGIYNEETASYDIDKPEDKDERSRKSKMKRRTDGWEAAKAEVAKELGLWDKVQAQGWASLTASESGRLGGVLSGRFPGKAPQYAPGSRRHQKKA